MSIEQLDMPRIQALLTIAGDICGQKIPGIYRDNGVGEAVERQVVTMLTAALDCLSRAALLAADDVQMMKTIVDGMTFLDAQIEQHRDEADAWVLAMALVERSKSTLH